MINKQITGTNNCWYCNHKINWATKPIGLPGQAVMFDYIENAADATAVEKNDDKTTKFEIVVRCKSCMTMNKFTVNYK